jgi:5'(3')-deoxyribonucleotidase
MKRIVCDVDGVLLDFIGALCTRLQSKGFALTPQDVKHWELKESFAPDALRASFEIMAEPGFCQSIAWYEGARDFFEQLRYENDVDVLTAPSAGATWMHERKEAIASTGYPWERVHFVGGRYKHRFSGDVLIEDHPGTAARWLQENRHGHAILIDRPWNQPTAAEYVPCLRMYRANSYSDALTTIRECL